MLHVLYIDYRMKGMDKELLIGGCMYHIYNRGNNREDIFKEPRNFYYFLQLWRKHICPIANTYAYSLQPNHFHFLIEIHELGEVANTKNNQAFSNLFNAYTKSINKAYGRSGSLFQKSFKRKLINDDSYFTQLIFYIHSNAQKHGLINDFTHYPYSSYLSIISNQPTLLCRDKVLEWFGGKERYEEYHLMNQKLLPSSPR
jgi:REP element-mobilizing transposase RayT